MELRKTAVSAMLLAIGLILHQITPAIGGVTFDLPLAMLFVIIAINMDFKNTLVASLATGIITALTTKFPGGQIPNIIDKTITGILVYLILVAITKKYNKQIGVIIAGVVGTLISGTIFLGSALLIVGLPAPFKFLFAAVVVPTAIANMFVAPFLFNLVNMSKKVLKIEM